MPRREDCFVIHTKDIFMIYNIIIVICRGDTAMIKILLVDDEFRIRKVVKDFLTAKGYAVTEAVDGEEAVEKFMTQKDIQLIILDVMLPKMDGWQVCRAIREHSSVPIVMLTARGEEADELYGFDLGADEYISKPFSPSILVARVESLLKRNHVLNGEEIKVGKLTVNREAHTVNADGTAVELSFKEFELLNFFIDNRGLALSRDKILNNVWDFDYFGDVRTVDTHVKKLRSKLLGCGDYLKTVRGIGYKFEVENSEE